MSFEHIPEQSEDIAGRPVAWALGITVFAILACVAVVWALDLFRLEGGGESPRVHTLELVPPARPFTMQVAPAPTANDRCIEQAIDRYLENSP